MTAEFPRTPAAEHDDTLSLRQQLVNWLFTPLFLLLLFSTVTGYMAAVTLANQPYDLVLLERARLLASRHLLAPGDDLAATYRLFPGQAEDFRFSLHDMAGNGILAIGRLPKPRPLDYQIQAPQWRDTQFQGRKLRLVTFRFAVAGGDALLAQAAEPIDARQSLGRSILGNIVIPQFMFIVIAGIAVWIGLKRGFEPLERLRREVAARPRDDPQPLDATRAPDEVRPLILEVNALIERLKTMMEAQRRFVADAAHQLRTPFAGLKARRTGPARTGGGTGARRPRTHLRQRAALQPSGQPAPHPGPQRARRPPRRAHACARPAPGGAGHRRPLGARGAAPGRLPGFRGHRHAATRARP